MNVTLNDRELARSNRIGSHAAGLRQPNIDKDKDNVHDDLKSFLGPSMISQLC